MPYRRKAEPIGKRKRIAKAKAFKRRVHSANAQHHQQTGGAVVTPRDRSGEAPTVCAHGRIEAPWE